MKCPYCGKQNDKVIETKQSMDGCSIRRRRTCLSCGRRFTSYEHIKENHITVIKRNGTQELFDMLKIERGIRKSLEKRPVTEQQLQNTLRDIEDEVHKENQAEGSINTEKVGEIVLSHLFQLDKVAYIRFASVYKKFNSVDEFVSEIAKLNN